MTHNIDEHKEKHSKGQVEKPKLNVEPHIASVKHPAHEKQADKETVPLPTKSQTAE